MRVAGNVDKKPFYAYNAGMKQNTKLNSFALVKWIVDNGEQKAKAYLCSHVGITASTLNRLLAGDTTPRLEHRYKIYSVTGISLLESDNFPEAEIKPIAS